MLISSLANNIETRVYNSDKENLKHNSKFYNNTSTQREKFE